MTKMKRTTRELAHAVGEALQGKSELEILKEELERVSNAAFFMSMSDNFCYSTGRIYPLLNKEKDLKKRIAELEKGEADAEV